MGRLFWKFFFAFWLILIAAGAGVGITVWSHKPPGMDPEVLIAISDRVDMDISLAQAVVDAGGQEALRAVLIKSGDRFPLRVIDDQGQELLGRPISSELAAHVRRLAETSTDTTSVRKVILADGRSLILFVPLVALPHRGRPADMPAKPPRDMFPKPPSPWLPIGFGLFASIVFSALLAWTVAKPIRLLRRAFGLVAHGKLQTRVHPLIGRRRDELGDLCQDFDHMAQRLEVLVTSQRRLFHDVSHELRSPLARIQAAIGLSRQNSAKTALSLDRVEREAERIDDLVGELLTLARLESGVPGAAQEEIDVAGLLAGGPPGGTHPYENRHAVLDCGRQPALLL